MLQKYYTMVRIYITTFEQQSQAKNDERHRKISNAFLALQGLTEVQEISAYFMLDLCGKMLVRDVV